MFGPDRTHLPFFSFARSSAALLVALVGASGSTAAQDATPAVRFALPGESPFRLPGFTGLSSFSIPGFPARPWQLVNAIADGLEPDAESAARQGLPAGGPRRITLQLAQQQSANRAATSLAYLSHLSVEAAKQHRLAVEADYFPKF